MTNLYDALGRVTVQRLVGGGTNTFSYTARGLTNQVNELGLASVFTFDAVGRKTAEVNPKRETNQFSYNGAGLLAKLTDARQHETTWGHDEYGRVRSKTNALGKFCATVTMPTGG